MLASLSSSTVGFNIVPAHNLAVAARRANPFMVTEAEAKAAWLAKLDAPAWGAAGECRRGRARTLWGVLRANALRSLCPSLAAPRPL
jgi:hypothetical protein